MGDAFFLAVFKEGVPPEVAERAHGLVDGRAYKLLSNSLLISLPDRSAHSVLVMLVPDYDLVEDPIAVVVFKLDGSYSGNYYKSLWDWLEEIPKSAVRS